MGRASRPPDRRSSSCRRLVARRTYVPRPSQTIGASAVTRLALLTILALGFAASTASAGTFPVPSDTPIATVSIPDSWDPKAYARGVEATSADGEKANAADLTKTSESIQATK